MIVLWIKKKKKLYSYVYTLDKKGYVEKQCWVEYVYLHFYVLLVWNGILKHAFLSDICCLQVFYCSIAWTDFIQIWYGSILWNFFDDQNPGTASPRKTILNYNFSITGADNFDQILLNCGPKQNVLQAIFPKLSVRYLFVREVGW